MEITNTGQAVFSGRPFYTLMRIHRNPQGHITSCGRLADPNCSFEEKSEAYQAGREYIYDHSENEICVVRMIGVQIIKVEKVCHTQVTMRNL